MNKIPGWVVPSIIAILSVATVWGQVRADVENINRRLEGYENLAQQVSSLKSEVSGLSRNVEQIQTGQMEMGRDIKQILRRNT